MLRHPKGTRLILIIASLILAITLGLVGCTTISPGPHTPVPTPTPTPSPEPAKFVVSGLSISPSEVKAGESVTISVDVANSGGTTGTHTVTLKVNGSELATKSLTLDPGQSQGVTFAIKTESGGTNTVEVNGQKDTFTARKVETPEPTPKPTSDCTCYSYKLKRNIPCDQATAICRDGTCSTSTSRRGTCSHHGGVRTWLD